MKFSFIAFAALFGLAACKNEPSKANVSTNTMEIAADTARYTTVQWIDTVKSLGQLNFGETATINFKFKNTGSKPLFIVSAEPGCGCTIADYPKEAIAAGNEGTITAQFDTNKGSEGEFRKNIIVTTNTQGNTAQVLYFMGTIVKGAAQ